MPESTIDPEVTAVVLCGGRGSRLGGVDKGLIPLGGKALALWVAQSLARQAGTVLISANRNFSTYRAMGFEVITDRGAAPPLDAPEPQCGPAQPGEFGPLGGILAALKAASTPYLAIAPCDAPLIPAMLIQRLRDALDESGKVAAVACSPALGAQRVGDPCSPLHQPHWTICLLKADRNASPDTASTVIRSLEAYLACGQRRVGHWLQGLGVQCVAFESPLPFQNLNTEKDIEAIQATAAHYLASPTRPASFGGSDPYS